MILFNPGLRGISAANLGSPTPQKEVKGTVTYIPYLREAHHPSTEKLLSGNNQLHCVITSSASLIASPTASTVLGNSFVNKVRFITS